jgi:macrolide transport system ATP-binding/permease protein
VTLTRDRDPSPSPVPPTSPTSPTSPISTATDAAARPGRAPKTVAPAGMWPRDLLDEAIGGLFARPGRTALTVLGTVIGLAALVATVGLSRTAGAQIIGRFDELAATEVTVTAKAADPDAASTALPWDGGARVARINGVEAAGTLSSVDVGEQLVSATPVQDPARRSSFKLVIQAASPSLFGAVRARLLAGRLPDEGMSARAERAVVLGPNAARQLGIGDLSQLPAVTIGDQPFLVVGVLQDVARKFEMLNAVILPEGTARQLYRLKAPESVVIQTRVGAAGVVSRQAPYALRPDLPDGLKVVAPEEPSRVRAGVSRDLYVLFLMLGAVSLLVGAIGIANVTLVSVMERTGEIGLRRALGATRRHIAGQFLLESAAMGALGGLLGASVGLIVVVAVTAYQSWTPVVDPLVPATAPLVGAVIGLLAGIYPSLRAARMEPVDALRAGT